MIDRRVCCCRCSCGARESIIMSVVATSQLSSRPIDPTAAAAPRGPIIQQCSAAWRCVCCCVGTGRQAAAKEARLGLTFGRCMHDYRMAFRLRLRTAFAASFFARGARSNARIRSFGPLARIDRRPDARVGRLDWQCSWCQLIAPYTPKGVNKSIGSSVVARSQIVCQRYDECDASKSQAPKLQGQQHTTTPILLGEGKQSGALT